MPEQTTSIEPLKVHFGGEDHPSSRPEHARVAVVVLDQGKPVVVLDHDLIRRLEATLRGLPRDAAGVVLASAAPRAFVAGADLKAIQAEDEGGLSDDQLHRYLEYAARVFAMLADLPCPTAAAINGAVLGGGLELAMHCDGLVGAPSPSGKPYPVGLPEAGLRICPGWGGTNLLPTRMDPAEAIRFTATGKTFTSEDARGFGLFDAWADDPARLVETACDWVLSRARPERDGLPSRCIENTNRAAVLEALDAVRGELPNDEVAAAVADCVDIGVTKGWREAIARERDHLVRFRNLPPGRAAIRAFFERGR